MPTLFRFTDPKLATPDEGASAPPPESVAPPGLLRIESVTKLLAPVAILPKASRMVTETVCVWSAARLPGCAVTERLNAGPGRILNAPETAGVSTGEDVACSV